MNDKSAARLANFEALCVRLAARINSDAENATRYAELVPTKAAETLATIPLQVRAALCNIADNNATKAAYVWKWILPPWQPHICDIADHLAKHSTKNAASEFVNMCKIINYMANSIPPHHLN